jgi:transposase
LEALREELTRTELAEKHDLHANQISRWKSDVVSGADDVFGGPEQNKKDSEAEIDKLHSKIGQLTMERDFLSKALGH